MYLERVNSKGHTYLYLKKYHVRPNYFRKDIIVYKFGRIEDALLVMYRWRKEFDKFPEELSKLGCSREHLRSWIRTLETGIHKTGRVFATY